MENAQELWNKVKKMFENSIDEQTFKQTIEPIEFYKYQNNLIILKVKNNLESFKFEKFHQKNAEEFLSKITNEPIRFKVITNEQAIKDEQERSEQNFTSANPKEKIIKVRSLRSEYTFDNFIAGETNKEAVTFAKKVAESPNVTINPFYIFGDVGLGKTHLMTAIGHSIAEKHTKINIVFTTAQQFVEDYFKSKNKNQRNTVMSDDFDNYYRSADVLLVDDVQYLENRQGSQDEFFKLFEYLFENNKQIIITSDRKASELNIMARLKSRFAWGMQTDIRKPNQQMREAILRKKLKYLLSEPEAVSDEIVTYIAQNFDQNVRELEGAIRRFVSYCVSFNIEFSLKNAEIALASIISKESKSNNQEFDFDSIEKIKSIVAGYYNINVKELSSPSRKQEFVYARNIVVYLLKTKYNLSLNKIGTLLGGRDHATIAHAYEKIQELSKNDVNVKEDIKNLTNSLDKIYN